MNILISRLEKCRFVQEPGVTHAYGGFDPTALMFLALANRYPQHTFYLIGPSSISLLADCPKNLIDLDQPIRDTYKRLRLAKQKKERYEVAVDYCKQFKFDLMLCYYCHPVTLSDYNYGYLSCKGTPRIIRKCEQMFSYIMAVPKAFSVPVYYLIDDIAELNSIPYDADIPAGILSQYSGTTTIKHYKDISTIENVTVPVTYKPIERIWLMGKHKVDWRNFNKTNDFILVCNTTNDGTLDRFNYIDKWVLSNFKDTIVYGRWTSPKKVRELIENRGLSDRFVYKGMCEMEDLMFNTKYTLIIPLSKKYPDFVTQKAFSMLYYGIIPFWCKNDYDCSNTKYNMFPDYIKVESPEELLYKINELNSNPRMYIGLLEELYTLLDDRYFNGDIINDIFDEVLV